MAAENAASLRHMAFFVLCALATAWLWQASPALAAKAATPSSSAPPVPAATAAAHVSTQARRDFAKILIAGAREEVARRPWYRSAYYSGGFPPENEGVCTDLIWRAFTFAGYDLKRALDADIKKNKPAYPRAARPDPNIDFRRVPNQTVFFRRHAAALTTRIDTANLNAWQPGDIVVFANPDHIAIVSDKRNQDGIPLLLHNQGPFATEGDDFMAWYARGIVAHFRFTP
ncbi:conserved exported hypothetical protein [uncultured delta proteobacterium]|uniref:DUF1287 domain-containing protein n=1 Tax=uncultured delta proteobacterium TaxID=34034 RepID=A0A212ITH9_9DELT|nr:conserved exported hypothetical protein [uncultured delta proteobacterium]